MNEFLLFNMDFLFAVDIPVNSHLCKICGKKPKELNVIIFRYYNKAEEKLRSHNFYMCKKCYDDKIKGKELKELAYIIPMIKITKGFKTRGEIYDCPYEDFKKFKDDATFLTNYDDAYILYLKRKPFCRILK